jgi:hypothetical protein
MSRSQWRVHAVRHVAFQRDAFLGTPFALTVRMATQRSASLISDVVPTQSDVVTNVTRMELSRALRSLDAAAADVTLNDDVFLEDTIEAPLACASDEPTHL